MSTIQAVTLAIVEGITEFLPISSTGHMILVSSFMGIEKDDFTKVFEIAVQMGAILAVVVLYWRKFFQLNWKFFLKLFIAVIPALVAGALFSSKIDLLLQSPKIVALTLLGGGFVLLVVDRVFSHHEIEEEKDISFANGLIIGIWQCVAMIPGVSRSAMSIIGGMQQKLTRGLAAEFSFFLAVPTMAAATGYKLMKTYKTNPAILQNKQNLVDLGIGNVIAFIVAMIAIKFFITFITKYGFKYFGWYRIIVGMIMLMFIFIGAIR